MTQILPDDAPFSDTQRSWLDGFFSAALKLEPKAPAPIGAKAPPLEIEMKAPQRTVPAPKIAAYDREHPFPARIVHVTRLCGEDSQKDVRAIALSLKGSGLKYTVGDALGVYPENEHELVEQLLAALGASGEEPVVTPDSRVVPMRIALLLGYDITRVGEDLLQLLARTSGDDGAAATLQELADDDKNSWLEGRDVLDVLQRFPSSTATPEEIVASLSPLQPRLYSIASSQNAHPDEVHLTVGVVRYYAGQRARKGVASTYLSENSTLDLGRRVGVFVHPAPGFRLPEDGNTPIIMVGPGTGIAPFRAFLQERRAMKTSGKNWLFFGDQRQHCDYLYRSELEEFLSDTTLARLDTAFSRDQDEKIYVQNRMLENGAEIWHWLEEGAHFYVCGDAKRMAKDVDNALRDLVAEHGQMSEGEAREFVQGLTKARRYQRDVY